MSDAPTSEAGVAELVRAAHAAREPLAVEGNGTKRGMLRPVQAARTLSTRALAGITLYRPTELVISARAGTPIPEIEATLAAKGQHLIAEPPDLAWLWGADRPSTLGGVVGANLSGPRRIAWGATRDHVLGVRFVSGEGEIFRSGGRVLKNVTGLDLAKLLTGAHGTLGILTEVTLKVLPAPEATATLVFEMADIAAGVRVLSAALGSPYGVSGAALTMGDAGVAALVRIEDFVESVSYRLARLREDLAPRFGDARVVHGEEARGLWRGVRDARPLLPEPGEAVWRLSLAPSRAPAACAALRAAGVGKLLLDWGGGLVWCAGPPAAHAAVAAAATSVTPGPGTFTLFRAPDALRSSVLPDEPPALAAISARVKAALDPQGILNPGRMWAGR